MVGPSVVDPHEQARHDAQVEKDRLAKACRVTLQAAAAAAERVHAALACVFKACAAAQDLEDNPPSLKDDMDVPKAMLFHEAATVLNLHAQDIAIQNARNLMPVILDSSYGNYSCCRE